MDYAQLGEQLYFSKEAAEYLGISTQRLNKLVQEGKIQPLKKSNSGTIFHVDELKKRKEELSIFSKTIPSKSNGIFVIDSPEKQEALNFATLMNALNFTENRLDPLFDGLTRKVDVSIPLINILDKYSDYFHIDADSLVREYENCEKAFSGLRQTDEIIKRGGKDYPPLLMKTQQAPRFLYIRGKKSLLYETRTVALVGSRQASDAAKDNTRRLALKLGENGITVVSGLAKGIDVTAHKTALDNGFNTISVIGTNLNQYYPAENKEVQLEIEKKGLVVSQFSPATRTQRYFFPLRNGVMSGLSLATVIVEAGETSGALRQADFALKQKRQVIIPRKALEMTSITWPKRYVQKGALVVDKPSEVLRILAQNRIFMMSEYNESGYSKQVHQETLEEYFNTDTKESEETDNVLDHFQSGPVLVEG